MFNAFWHSTDGVTPQEISAKMGGNAAAFFALASQNVTHIATCAAIVGKTLGDYLQPSEYVPPQQVVVNQNGSVTIG